MIVLQLLKINLKKIHAGTNLLEEVFLKRLNALIALLWLLSKFSPVHHVK